MSSNSFRAEHAQCTHSPPRLKQMPHRQQWPATIPPRQYYSNIMQWPTTPLLTCRIAGICRRYNHYNAICIHTLQNTKGEPITIETIQTAPAAHTRCLSSPAAATLDGKTQGFVPMSPLPSDVRSHTTLRVVMWCKVSHHPPWCIVMCKFWHHPSWCIVMWVMWCKVSHHPSWCIVMWCKVSHHPSSDVKSHNSIYP